MEHLSSSHSFLMVIHCCFNQYWTEL